MSQREVGEAIRNAREARDLTQEEFGKLLGVSRETVRNWETGGMFPRNKAGRILDQFGIDIRAIRDAKEDVLPRDPSGEDALLQAVSIAADMLDSGEDPKMIAGWLRSARQRRLNRITEPGRARYS